ncbi:MAG: hypothetical protein IH593_12305 [Bacteroidales bacterium]|nr:hypothetical protein [Bacteroidales bacterium]
MTKEGEKHPPNWWMKLDNAAKIYPAITGSELTGVFRITAVLSSPVVLSALRRSVTETSKLFPSFSVELCKGFFWYYLEYNGNEPRILADEGPRCQTFPRNIKGELMYRVLTRNNTVSVEFLHILTDGGGAMFFLKTLLNYYFLYSRGIESPPFPDVVGGPPPGGTEDLFTKFYGKGLPHPPVLPMAWHLPYKLRETPRFRVTSFGMSSLQLTTVAKEHGATITEFLGSVFLFVLQEMRLSHGKGSPHIRVQIPFDLRKKFDSFTLRNFSLFVLPEIDIRLGPYTFDEILQEVKMTIQMSNEKRIRKIISRNVSNEKNPVIRAMPLFIKSPVLRMAYRKFGPSQFTSIITNMGRVMPEGPATEFIEAFSVTPPPPHKDIKVTCGLISLGANTILTFGSLTDSAGLEREYVRFLTKAGITVKLLNNS